MKSMRLSDVLDANQKLKEQYMQEQLQVVENMRNGKIKSYSSEEVICILQEKNL